MKLAKMQYKKREKLMPIAKKSVKISSYKFMCKMLYIIGNGCKQRALQKKIWKMAHNLYEIQQMGKNVTIAKAVVFSLKS